MAKRRINWTAAVVLLMICVVLGVTAATLRAVQRKRMALSALKDGVAAYNDGRWRQAAVDLGRYVALHPQDIDILIKYADAQLKIRPLKQGNVQQAVAAYRSVLRFQDDNSTAVNRLMDLYLQMGAASEAQFVGERYLQVIDDPAIRRMTAMALEKQRQFKNAADQLQTIIDKNPNDIAACEALGRIVERHPEYFSMPASDWFDMAVEKNPQSADALIARAGFYIRRGDIKDGTDDLNLAEKLDISSTWTRLRLAAAYADAALAEKAKEHLAMLREKEPSNIQLWRTWAALAMKTGRREEMCGVAEDGLAVLGEDSWDFIPMACELFIHCGDFRRAEECLDRLRSQDVLPATVATLSGFLAEAQGRYYEAIEAWRTARQLGDNSARTSLGLARCLVRVGDERSAIGRLQALVLQMPDLVEGRLALAAVLGSTGNWAEATDHVAQALRIAPDNQEAAMFEVRARLELARSRGQVDEITLRNLQKRADALARSNQAKPEGKLLAAELAVTGGNFDEARRIIADLKAEGAGERIDVCIAEVDLLVAEGKSDQAISEMRTLNRRFPMNPGVIRKLAVLSARADRRADCEQLLIDAVAAMAEPAAKRELGVLLADLYARWDMQEKAYALLSELAGQLNDDIPIKKRLLMCPGIASDRAASQGIIDAIRSIEGEGGRRWRTEQARLWIGAEDFSTYYPAIVKLLTENLVAYPMDQESRMLLAAAYEKSGDLRLAISIYRDALDRSPRDISIIIPTVAALYRAGEYDLGDAVLDRASELKLVHPELLRLRLAGLVQEGELSSAEKILQQLAGEDPEDRKIAFSLALLQMRQGKYDQAGRLLAQLKAELPGSPEVTAALAELEARQGNLDAAIALCNDMISRTEGTAGYVLRGRTYAMLGRNQEALSDFEKAAGMDPNDAQIRISRGRALMQVGRNDQAVDDVLKAAELEPANLAVLKNVLSLLLLAGGDKATLHYEQLLNKSMAMAKMDPELNLYKAKYLLTKSTGAAIEQARIILDQVCADRPTMSEAWALLTEIDLNSGQSGRAMSTVLRGLSHLPGDIDLMILKAKSEAAHSPNLAIPTLRQIIEADPRRVGPIVFLAEIYGLASQHDEALDLLERAIAGCSQDCVRLKIARITALHRAGRRQEAADRLEVLRKSSPDDSRLFLVEAAMLQKEGSWDQVKSLAQRRLKDLPSDTQAVLVLANQLAASAEGGAGQTAQDILRAILSADPDNQAAAGSLAMLLQVSGNTAEAARLYRGLLDIDPDNTVAANNLAWIICEQQQNCAEALELAERSLQKAPDYADLVDTIGVIQYRLGNYGQALEHFNRCLELYPPGSPGLALSRFHLGRTLVAMGQANQAADNLRGALELDERFGGLSASAVTEIREQLKTLSQ